MAILRVKTIFQGWLGGPGLMTNYFAATAPLDASRAQLAGDRVQNSLVAAVGMFLDATNWKNELVVDSIDEANGDLITSFNITAVSHAGSGNTNLLPPSNQMCVSWKTDGVANGHRVRGRTFLGPLALSAAEGNGTPTAACIASATAFATSMADAGATDLRHVIWHRPGKGLSNGSHHDVIEHTIRDKFAVLRSRRD